jgi:uncharacterized protein YfkK (UPF0435 family)
MGGKAILSQVSAERINKEEYLSVVDRVSAFTKYFKDSHGLIGDFADLKTFSNKNDFGDLDYLIGFQDGFDRKLFEMEFNRMCNDSYFPVVNGPVTSFAYEIEEDRFFQIDIFYINQDDFKICYDYHGNGDLGNFLGRIFHKLGLKFGHTGLSYIHRNETYVVGEINLSKDFSKILDFIGLDIEDANFSSITDVYDFVMSSPFFDPQAYQWSDRNHDARVRDRKRPSYNSFLEYMKGVESNPIAGKDYYMVAIRHFGKINEYYALLDKEAQRIASKVALSPSFIKEHSGKENKDLGDLIQLIKKQPQFSPESIIENGFKKTRENLLDFLENG